MEAADLCYVIPVFTKSYTIVTMATIETTVKLRIQAPISKKRNDFIPPTVLEARLLLGVLR